MRNGWCGMQPELRQLPVSVAARIAARIRQEASSCRNEAQLRSKVQPVIDKLMRRIAPDLRPVVEEPISGPAGARRVPDVVWGTTILDYKSPAGKGRLATTTGRRCAQDDLERYLDLLVGTDKIEPSRYQAVALDGHSALFVQRSPDGRGWVSEWHAVSASAVQKLYLALWQGVQTRPQLTGERLVWQCGPQQRLFLETMSALCRAFRAAGRPSRAAVLFEEWRKLFSQVSGYQRERLPGTTELARRCGCLSRRGDMAEFVWCLHTYFALLAKLIAAEYVSQAVFGKGLIAEGLVRRSPKGVFLRVESGEVFRRAGIRNFLDGDFFGWYLDSWTPQLEACLKQVLVALNSYRFDAPLAHDVLRRFYQGIVPEELRRSLGEYYTPEWIVDLALREVGWPGSGGLKLLDPCCGSGTFLVRAIEKLRTGPLSGCVPADAARKLVASVKGIDLNPAAVVAARCNYLLAMGPELVRGAGELEIPVYLADSVVLPEAVPGKGLVRYRIEAHGESFDFFVPEWCFSESLLWDFFGGLQEAARQRDWNSDAPRSLRARARGAHEEQQLQDAWRQSMEALRRLEQKRWNKVWCPILANYFSPRAAGAFDVVVGNPSWVRWSLLPEAYRSRMKDVWRQMGLFSKERYVGGIELDVSAVLMYSAIAHWLAPSGTMAYLVPRSLFKTASTSGLRKLAVTGPSGEKPFRIITCWDLTELKPFGGRNEPVLVVIRNGAQTTFPVPWRRVRWKRKP